MAYRSPSIPGAAWSFAKVSGFRSRAFPRAASRWSAANFAQSAREAWTDPAGPMAGGLSASGPGSTGFPSSPCPRGSSRDLRSPGAPNPALSMARGRKRRSRRRSSQGFPAARSAMAPAMAKFALA